MSPTDQLQDLFDLAVASVPSRTPAPPRVLRARLHRRQLRARVTSIATCLLAVVVSVSALVVGLTSNSAFAVTLYPYYSGPPSITQLSADQRVMTARLHAVGFPNASVSVSDGTLVVLNGPKGLTNPTSWLTSSPELLVRSVTCYAGAQEGSFSQAQLPSSCSKPEYDSHPVSGFTWPTLQSDPSLAAFATTTPAQDAKSPNSSALLPVLNEGTSGAPRYLVGPTLLTLSSKVASVKLTHMPLSGGWVVDITLNAAESRQWDRVAKKYFHRQLAVDLNGVIVDAPFIQPGSTSFTSFDGQMDLLAVTKSNASDLAAALSSGPLAEPLSVSPWRTAVQVKGPVGFNNVGDQVAVNSVACASRSSCSAVGFISNSHITQPFVANERDGVWSTATIPTGIEALNHGENGGQLDDVSCTSGQDCTAAGWYTTGSQQTKVFVVRESKGQWAPTITISGPSIPKGNAILSDVIACASAVDCVVSGNYSGDVTAQAANPPRPFIIDEVNGHWQRAISMTFAPSTKPFVNVTSVACRSVGNCAIGGDFESTQTALIDTETNGVWGEAVPVPGVTAFGRFSSNVASISCGSANTCSAGGTYANRSGDRIGFVTNQVNGRWREMQTITGAPDLHLDSNSEITALSCRAAGDCSALGDSNFRANGEKLFVLRESKGIWGGALNLRGATNASYQGFYGATLSCGSPSDCVVAGIYGISEKFSSGNAPFVADEIDGTWTRAIEVPGMEKLDAGNYDYVQAVSCWDDDNCAVVGGYGADGISAFFATTRTPIPGS
jgi:hypothetical protein